MLNLYNIFCIFIIIFEFLKAPNTIDDADHHPNLNISKSVAESEEIRRVAYLLDAKTIAVVNLANGVQLAQIGHGLLIFN